MNRFLKIMPRGYWAASTILAIIIGAVMATTDTPNVGTAVTDLNESPAVLRIGVVTDIVEADNITVRISGSPVLVQASYLFPLYQPLLGDRVIVTKQDAQWFVTGTMSGPNNSVIPNPSFEIDGGTPQSWTVVNDTVTAGVPTTVHTVGSFALDGTGFVTVQLIPTGLGASVTRLVSDQVPADPGTRWTGAAFSWATQAQDNTTVAAEVLIRFLDGGGATLSVTTMSVMSSNSRQLNWAYNRTTFDPYVSAPANTEFVTLELLTRFSVVNAALSAGQMLWDRAILRGPV